MDRRYACLLVGCSLLLSAAGCGTFSNVMGDDVHMVYGGVRRDGVILRECGNGPPKRASDDPDAGVVPFVSNMAAATAFMDLPFSFVGDTITLPYTLCCAIAQGGDVSGQSYDERPRSSARSSTTTDSRR